MNEPSKKIATETVDAYTQLLAAGEQAIFDYVTDRLFEQRYPSQAPSRVGAYVSCAYRGEADRRCAIGMLMPDEVYTPRLESMKLNFIIQLFEKERGIYGKLMDEHEGLLYALQGAHDQSASEPSFLKALYSKLTEVAVDWKLNTANLVRYKDSWKSTNPAPTVS